MSVFILREHPSVHSDGIMSYSERVCDFPATNKNSPSGKEFFPK